MSKLRLYLGRRDSNFLYSLCHHAIKNEYEVGTDKKYWNRDYGFRSQFIAGFSKALFEEVTGIKLKPGEIRRIESINIQLK